VLSSAKNASKAIRANLERMTYSGWYLRIESISSDKEVALILPRLKHVQGRGYQNFGNDLGSSAFNRLGPFAEDEIHRVIEAVHHHQNSSTLFYQL
jgi:hypothetical protein